MTVSILGIEIAKNTFQLHREDNDSKTGSQLLAIPFVSSISPRAIVTHLVDRVPSGRTVLVAAPFFAEYPRGHIMDEAGVVL